MRNALGTLALVPPLPRPATPPAITPAEAGVRAAAAEAEAVNPRPWLDKVVHGDCTQILRRLPEDSVDMVLTDPPYLSATPTAAAGRYPTTTTAVGYSPPSPNSTES